MRRKAILRREELGLARVLRFPAACLMAVVACSASLASAPSSLAAPGHGSTTSAPAARVAQTTRPARSGNEALLFALGVALALGSGTLMFVLAPGLAERRLRAPHVGPLVRRRHLAGSISALPPPRLPRVQPPRLSLPRVSLRLPRINPRHWARSISEALPRPRLRPWRRRLRPWQPHHQPWQRVARATRDALGDLRDVRRFRLGRLARRRGAVGLALPSLAGLTPTKPWQRTAQLVGDRLDDLADLRFIRLRYLARAKPELVWGLAAGALAVAVGVVLGLLI